MNSALIPICLNAVLAVALLPWTLFLLSKGRKYYTVAALGAVAVLFNAAAVVVYIMTH